MNQRSPEKRKERTAAEKQANVEAARAHHKTKAQRKIEAEARQAAAKARLVKIKNK